MREVIIKIVKTVTVDGPQTISDGGKASSDELPLAVEIIGAIITCSAIIGGIIWLCSKH